MTQPININNIPLLSINYYVIHNYVLILWYNQLSFIGVNPQRAKAIKLA